MSHASKNGRAAAKSASGSAGVSTRRVKEAAGVLKKLIDERSGGPVLSDTERLEWAARMLGFESYERALSGGAASGKRNIAIRHGESAGKGYFQKKRPVMLDETAILGHEILLGSTGAGKTEVLVSRADQILGAGLGCIYFDAKGDPSVFFKLDRFCHARGRQDDMRVVNLMGRHDHGAVSESKRSHSFNPLHEMGPEGELAWLEMVFGPRMKKRGVSEKASLLFAAAAFTHALLKGRDGEDPGMAGLAPWLSPRRMEKILAGPREYLPAEAWEKIDELHAVVGDDWDDPELSLVKTLSSDLMTGWLETYPDVFATLKNTSGEWLSPEVGPSHAMDGGLTIVLLPALEKSPDELAILGGAILASMVLVWEGSPCERGGLRTVAILDETGYLLPCGYRRIMDAASSSGVGLVLAGQDATAMCGLYDRKGRSEMDLAASELCSCRIKTFMKCEGIWDHERLLLQSAFGRDGIPERDALRQQKAGEAIVALPGFSGNVTTEYSKTPDGNFTHVLAREACPVCDRARWKNGGAA